MHTTDTVTILKALADKTRLDIVRTLVSDSDESAPCSEVSNCSSLSQPAMSHHFKKLVDAGILREQKSGTQKIYELNTEQLKALGIDPTKL